MTSNQENSQDTNAPDKTSEGEITRGITIMKNIIRDRDRGVKYDVNWNDDNQIIESNGAKLTSYIGTLARMHISITTDRWTNAELDSGKEKIWTDIKRSFNIEDNRKKYCLQLAGKRHRGWRAFLTNKYLKDEQGNFVKAEYPKKYMNFIGLEEWDAFVGKRIDDINFKKVSDTNRQRASKPMYPYKKGRLGYARLQQKILDETKSDETSLPAHVLWKEAHVGKDGVLTEDVQHIYDECETLSQLITTGEDQDNRSVLSQTLNVAEYPGRVRGKGHGVTPSSLYKHPRQKTPSNQEVVQMLEELKAQIRELQKDKERHMVEKCSSGVKETSDKASINCQNKFPEGISTCQLYLSSPTHRLVGKGKVHNTLGDLLYHRALPDGHLKVLVHVALDMNALLPIPDLVSETTLLRDAIGSFVAWPSDLIFICDETPTKPASRDKGILRHNESVALQTEVPAQESQQVSQKISRVPNKKTDLSRTVARKPFVPRFRMCLDILVGKSDLMDGAIRLMDMEEGIFGFSYSEIIAKEEMEQIFQPTELVRISHRCGTLIHPVLYDKLMRENQLSNRFHFVSAFRVNGASIVKDPDSVRRHLVERFMANSTKENLYLLPCHWLFIAIDPFKEVVYYLNSIDGDWTNYSDMKLMIDTSIQVFRSHRQARVSRSRSNNITWIKVECAQQRNGIDYGYFVMRFMKEILHSNRIDIPITYFDDYKCPHFTKNQLEEIKEELCEYFIEKRIY